MDLANVELASFAAKSRKLVKLERRPNSPLLVIVFVFSYLLRARAEARALP
jgi:hypothetical protein